MQSKVAHHMSYGFQPIKCQCCPDIETSHLIFGNQVTGFYMRETQVFNGSMWSVKFLEFKPEK